MKITIPGQTIKMDIETGIEPVWYDKLQALINMINLLDPAGGMAWPTFTPTVTASSGTFTTVSASGSYLQIGKMVTFICTINITTVGTASGVINLPLPVSPSKRAAALIGSLVNTGESILGQIAASDTKATIAKYNATTVIGAGNIVTVSGTYEAN